MIVRLNILSRNNQRCKLAQIVVGNSVNNTFYYEPQAESFAYYGSQSPGILWWEWVESRGFFHSTHTSTLFCIFPSICGEMRMISNLTLLSSSSEIELASSTAGMTSIKSSCSSATSLEPAWSILMPALEAISSCAYSYVMGGYFFLSMPGSWGLPAEQKHGLGHNTSESI